MERLTEQTEEIISDDFYDIIFFTMKNKMALCMDHREEMLMVNMATRDANGETARGKTEIMAKYMVAVKAESAGILQRTVSVLNLKNPTDARKIARGLHLYTNAVINRYLSIYQDSPEKFFENSENIKTEMKSYLDLMLYGICQ